MSTDIFKTLPHCNVPVSDGFDGEIGVYPEIDFRRYDEINRGKISTSYLTHSIQKHPATFIPQIPSYLLDEYLPDSGGTVLDIFSGSGTTGIESIIRGHNFVGIEVNPLSKLVSDVSTHPIPAEVFANAYDVFETIDVETTETTFPGRTDKAFWFESEATPKLEKLKAKLQELYTQRQKITIPNEVVEKTQYSTSEIQTQVWDAFVLIFSNVVFTVSNADPGVSKAYKSPKMKEAIAEGTHPKNAYTVFETEFEKAVEKINSLWNKSMKTLQAETNTVSKIPTSTVILGDAREVDIDHSVDVVISSPPYINAINYYRGSKLRLFWIADLLEKHNIDIDASELRKSIIGSNSSASIRSINTDTLPFTIQSIWTDTEASFTQTNLPELDTQIQNIYQSDVSNAPKKSYLVWKFFGEDMANSMETAYESLVDEGRFFFIIGENVVGGEFIRTKTYLEDIGANLNKIQTVSTKDSFTHIGTAFDEITNRELFQSRNHDGGVIECEWVLAFEK